MNDTTQYPKIDFTTFILSLASSVQIHLGLVPDPSTKQKSKNLPMAQQTINLLDLMKEKTKGNLSADEDKLFEDLLFNLRMQFVAITKGQA